MYEYNKEKDELTITTLKTPGNLYQYDKGTCFIRKYGDIIIIKDDGLHHIEIIKHASEFIPKHILNQLENKPEWVVCIEVETKELSEKLCKISVEVIKPEEQLSFFEKVYTN